MHGDTETSAASPVRLPLLTPSLSVASPLSALPNIGPLTSTPTTFAPARPSQYSNRQPRDSAAAASRVAPLPSILRQSQPATSRLALRVSAQLPHHLGTEDSEASAGGGTLTISGSYQRVEVKEPQLDLLLVSGNHNELILLSSSIDQLIISGMHNYIRAASRPPALRSLVISGRHNSVRSLHINQLSVTGSHNSIRRSQYARLSAVSHNKLIACERIPQEDNAAASLSSSSSDYYSHDFSDSDRSQQHQHPAPQRSSLMRVARAELQLDLNGGAASSLDRHPLPNVRMEVHFNGEGVSINGGGHRAGLSNRFENPHADISSEVNEQARPDQRQLKNLEKRVKQEWFRRNSSDDDVCAICLANLQSSRVRRLPCDHIFHGSCVIDWFREQMSCPVCRTSVKNLAD